MCETLLQPGDCLIAYEGSEDILEHIPAGVVQLITSVIEVQSIALHKLETRVAALESDLRNRKSITLEQFRRVTVTGLQ